jgi:DNA-directed RNA polymerase subunit omega
MARVTVEDCITVIPNRFELCLIANNRAKSILSGAATTLNKKEKPSVIALREIAEYLIDIENIRKNVVRNIKNRGISNYSDSLANSEMSEVIEEEIESQNLVLKDNMFLEDNINVDD